MIRGLALSEGFSLMAQSLSDGQTWEKLRRINGNRVPKSPGRPKCAIYRNLDLSPLVSRSLYGF